MATVVLNFDSIELFGQYLAQLEDAGLLPVDKVMVQKLKFIVVGQDLPVPDPAGTWVNENAFIFDDEVKLEKALNDATLPATWGIRNIGSKFVWAGIDGGGVFIAPETQAVLDRMIGLTQIETDAIIRFVNAEGATVGNGNWAFIDEFFSFGLVGANALVGFIAKTATNNGAVLSIEGATGDGIADFIDTNYNPTNDAINYSQNDAQLAVFVILNGLAGTVFQPVAGSRTDGVTRATIAQFTNPRVSGGINADGNTANIVFANLGNNKLNTIARENGTTMTQYQNGVGATAEASTSTPLGNRNLYVVAENRDTGVTFFNGIVATLIVGGAIGFNQATHYNNHLQYLIDLGTFATPVLARYVGLSDIETAAITKFVNAEVVSGNWGLYDEFFCFALAGANALIGMKSKTAVNTLATFSIEGATFNGTTAFIDTAFAPDTDGVNIALTSAQIGAFIKTNPLPASSTMLLGALSSRLRTSTAANFNGNINGAALANNLTGIQSDNLIFIQANGANGGYLKNGVSQSLTPETFISLDTLPIYVGARNNTGADLFWTGIISSFMVSGVLADQAAHYTNHLEFLIELGVFATPVLNRYSALTQTETDAITAFVNQEVRDGNWGLYDEFFCFSLNATDRLIGMKTKTATLLGVPTFDINGATLDAGNQINLQTSPLNDTNWISTSAMFGFFCFDKQVFTSDINIMSAGSSSARISDNPAAVRISTRLLSASTGLANGQIIESASLYMLSRTAGNVALFENGLSILNQARTFSDIPPEVFSLRGGGAGETTTISTAIIGLGVGFDQPAHNTNTRKLLTDLGVTLP